MQRVILLVLMLWALGFSGCAGDKGKELFETAQFEEKQHNLEHAKKLYGEIAQRYPGSEYARKAEDRLAALKEKSGKK